VPVIWARSDAHYRFASFTGGSRHSEPKAGQRRFATFAEATRAWKSADAAWVTPRAQNITGQLWLRKVDVDRLAPITWDRTGKKVAWAEGIPCHDTVSDGIGWSWSTCGRLAAGEAKPDLAKEELPLCKMHLNGYAKREANMERWRAEWDERDKKWDDEARNLQASEDWAARLRDEFGIHADGHRGVELRVRVKPEQLYGLLAELAGVLRDVEAPWPELPD
jgi:hypothetical protein